MNRRPLALVLVVVGTAATAGVLLSVGPASSLAGRSALAGAGAALSLAVAVVAFVRHRDTRDPHPLFVSAGFAVLGLHALVFSVILPVTTHLTLFLRTALPSYLLLAAWLVASAGFLAALPLWDRRGRPPIRAGVLFWTAGALVTFLDLALLLAHGAFPVIGTAAAARVPRLGALGALGWVVAAPATVMLVVAGVRELRAIRAPRSPHPWLSAAFVMAAAAPPLLLAYPALFPRVLEPTEVIQPVAAALAFVGFLVHQRSDVSRMRRESDRAREITGGRAKIAGMVAHEVRGPVTTIRGLAQTAARHFDLLSDPERREFLFLIEKESDRLLHITDQTSTALKVDAGTLEYRPEPRDLATVVRAGVDAADAAGHPVTVEATDGLAVRIDDRWIADCVGELVTNAAKFSPEGAPIDVRARLDGDAALIEVCDRGPGIAKELRERIFRKFPSVRPPGYEEVPGAGLGLFICKAHVRGHGGEIDVAEGPDGGTMLRIRLPVEGSGRAE